ncbi:MAG: hypothetical protein IKH02_10810, partial [Prevotella sp.]|nr:hypothetical protein [Prevotella sp.]
ICRRCRVGLSFMVNSWAIYGHSCKSDQIEQIKNTEVSHLLMLNNEHESTESTRIKKDKKDLKDLDRFE